MTTDLIFRAGFTLILALNVVGNALVIFLFVNVKEMKTPMNFLLLNLAVADMLVGLFFAPTFYVDDLLPPDGLGNFLCKTSTCRNFAWIASLVSAFCLLCVAIERFYAVVHPFDVGKKITERKVKVIVPACWILAIVHTIPSFLIKGIDSETQLCRAEFPGYWQKVAYWLIWLLSAGVFPVVSMAVLYSRVVHLLWLAPASASHQMVIKARKGATRKSITVSIVYALFVLPFHVLDFIAVFYPRFFPLEGERFKAAICFLVLNSSVNPLVYAFQCEMFRKHLKGLMRRVLWTRGN